MEDKIIRLAQLFKESDKAPVKRTPRTSPKASQSITGNGNIQAGGDVHIKTDKIVRKTEVKTGDGVVDAEQKQTIKELLAEWVSVHNRIKQSELSYGAAWARFQRHFRVNSYTELHAERFADAVKWLQRQRAIIDSMKTAPKRDAAWRRRQITYIKVSCKNQLVDERCYQPYIERNFGKSSLADLSDQELARTKAYIAQKKSA